MSLVFQYVYIQSLKNLQAKRTCFLKCDRGDNPDKGFVSPSQIWNSLAFTLALCESHFKKCEKHLGVSEHTSLGDFSIEAKWFVGIVSSASIPHL